LRFLNTFLADRKHFVGNSWTFADVDIFYTLRHFFQMVFNDNFRNQVFPNVTKWFVEMSNNEHIIKVIYIYLTIY
jgi:glutathione S-transferase